MLIFCKVGGGNLVKLEQQNSFIRIHYNFNNNNRFTFYSDLVLRLFVFEILLIDRQNLTPHFVCHNGEIKMFIFPIAFAGRRLIMPLTP